MNIINKSLLLLALFACLNKPAEAQTTKYQGSYYLYAGYYESFYSAYPCKGTFGLGNATLRSTGQASYTCYFPFEGSAWNGFDYVTLNPHAGSGTGVVNSTGVFSFNNGVSGVCQLWGTLKNGILNTRAVGMGVFTDESGNGIFGVVKYR
jgi:hypothetical protein